MKYEIRYIVDGDEFTEVVDVDTAAEAAETVKQHHEHPGDSFELIQVHLLDQPEDASGNEQEPQDTGS